MKNAVGYMLFQKYCGCISNKSFGCWSDGYKKPLRVPDSCTKLRKKYAPMEGENLAVDWSLEQTKHFTLECNDLVVVTDHKSLTKLLGDRRLDEIDNPRLFKLKK